MPNRSSKIRTIRDIGDFCRDLYKVDFKIVNLSLRRKLILCTARKPQTTKKTPNKIYGWWKAKVQISWNIILWSKQFKFYKFSSKTPMCMCTMGSACLIDMHARAVMCGWFYLDWCVRLLLAVCMLSCNTIHFAHIKLHGCFRFCCLNDKYMSNGICEWLRKNYEKYITFDTMFIYYYVYSMHCVIMWHNKLRTRAKL